MEECSALTHLTACKPWTAVYADANKPARTSVCVRLTPSTSGAQRCLDAASEKAYSARCGNAERLPGTLRPEAAHQRACSEGSCVTCEKILKNDSHDVLAGKNSISIADLRTEGGKVGGRAFVGHALRTCHAPSEATCHTRSSYAPAQYIYIPARSMVCAPIERAEAQRRRAGVAYATPALLLGFTSGLQRRPAPFRSQIIRSTRLRQRKRQAQHMRSDSMPSRTSIAECPQITLQTRAFDFRRRAVSDSAAISKPQSRDARAAPAATNRTRRMRPRPGNSAQRCSQAANRAA